AAAPGAAGREPVADRPPRRRRLGAAVTAVAGATPAILPADADRALLVGRVWDPQTGGPRPVVVRGEDVHDTFALAPTVSALLERDDAAADVVRGVDGAPRWRLPELVAASLAGRDGQPHLLAPMDLQMVK